MRRFHGQMTGIGTLWRTVRHLKARQVLGRARFVLSHPSVDVAAAPPRRAFQGVWSMPARRDAILTPPAVLRLLNTDYDLDVLGWDNPAVDRLLRYNAHYFDDLCAFGATSRDSAQRALVSRWIEENPAPQGTGWEPYPLSLRVVNWIKWFFGGAVPEQQWQHSLAIQARWLRARLETHLLGNHLFANAKALVHAGAWFSGDEAEEWLRCGLRILDEEIPEQILADGGQFERSPMYHALALEDLLDLINLSAVAASEVPALAQRAPEWRRVAARMVFWLRAMCHPDGSLALFNDCADGIAPGVDELARFAALLGIEAATPSPDGVTWLEQSGYLRIACGHALAILDAAPVGPDYLPGHAHADTLSFELTIGGRRVVVNGGTSRYGLGEERLAQRGTARHSTVQVANLDSSEVWSGFRVGRRARIRELTVRDSEVTASHDGYRHLRGAPIHERRWSFAAGRLSVTDSVQPAQHDSVARYILAPGLSLEAAAPNDWQITDAGREVARVEIVRGSARSAGSHHSREFGRQQEVRCLEVRLEEGSAVTSWSW